MSKTPADLIEKLSSVAREEERALDVLERQLGDEMQRLTQGELSEEELRALEAKARTDEHVAAALALFAPMPLEAQARFVDVARDGLRSPPEPERAPSAEPSADAASGARRRARRRMGMTVASLGVAAAAGVALFAVTGPPPGAPPGREVAAVAPEPASATPPTPTAMPPSVPKLAAPAMPVPEVATTPAPTRSRALSKPGSSRRIDDGGDPLLATPADRPPVLEPRRFKADGKMDVLLTPPEPLSGPVEARATLHFADGSTRAIDLPLRLSATGNVRLAGRVSRLFPGVRGPVNLIVLLTTPAADPPPPAAAGGPDMGHGWRRVRLWIRID